MTTILDRIIIQKRKEVELLRKSTSIRELEAGLFFTENTRSLREFLSDKDKSGIIAEFKRISPSKGVINQAAGIEEVTTGYSAAGASGLSILTDAEFFGGSCRDLTTARNLNNIPILRKDFILDELQVIESKSAGADAILLIASALGRDLVRDLACLSRSLGLEVLLEIHSPEELDKANEFINIIGVNNRDLATFKVNLGVSYEMADKIPGSFLKISESGISSPEVLNGLRKAGYDGFLIGSHFMASADPASSFADFVRKIRRDNDETFTSHEGSIRTT